MGESRFTQVIFSRNYFKTNVSALAGETLKKIYAFVLRERQVLLYVRIYTTY